MEIRLCMAGFGAVGQRFCRLLEEKKRELRERYGLTVKLVGVCTKTRGALLCPDGIPFGTLFDTDARCRSFADSPLHRDCGVLEMLREASADVFVELTTLSIRDGEPANSHIKAALKRGMHVITANKGPIACHFHDLRAIAGQERRALLYETIVMDGTPVFNLVEKTLRGNTVTELRGILNGTTNYILQQLERGKTYEEAIRMAQEIQLAEADPSMDVDGWDGAAKICAMANVFMDARLTPMDVDVTSLRTVTPERVKQVEADGKRMKYICHARTDAGQIKMYVKPEVIDETDPFYRVDGTSAALTLYTDLAGKMTIVQTDPGILQTAYGVYSDFLTLAAEQYGLESRS